jgi:hypothetical protein
MKFGSLALLGGAQADHVQGATNIQTSAIQHCLTSKTAIDRPSRYGELLSHNHLVRERGATLLTKTGTCECLIHDTVSSRQAWKARGAFKRRFLAGEWANRYLPLCSSRIATTVELPPLTDIHKCETFPLSRLPCTTTTSDDERRAVVEIRPYVSSGYISAYSTPSLNDKHASHGAGNHFVSVPL